MSFADLSPEKLAEMRRKSGETRRRNGDSKRAAAAVEQQAAAAETPPSLADLGLAAEPEDDLRLDDILTNEEIEAIKTKAREQVARERKQARAKLLMAMATEEARREQGLVPVDEAREKEMAEPVEIRINLPRLRLANNREAPPDPIILDQRMFVHGRTYTVPRVQAEYLMDLMNKAWMHVAQVDGRTKTYYNEQLGTMLHMGGIATGGSPAFTFDSLHRRPAA